MPGIEQLHASAWRYYHAGDRPAARRAANETLRQQPLSSDAIYLLGVLDLEEGHPTAMAHLHHATQLSPTNAAYRNALGEAYRARGAEVEAIACFLAAISLAPDNAAAHHGLGLVQLDQGALDEAISSFRRALAFRPDNERTHLNLGRALQIRGDAEAAAACYAESIRLKPDYAIAHNNLGAASQSRGRHVEAMTSFQRAIRCQPDYPEAHFNLGVSLAAQGDATAALESFAAAIRFRPQYGRAYHQMGRALESRQRMPEALAAYQSAFRLNPDDQELCRDLGNILMQARQWEAAHTVLRRGAELAPEDANSFACVAWARQLLCDWTSYQADVARLASDAAISIEAGRPTAIIPFQSLTMPWPAERLLEVARSHSAAIERNATEMYRGLSFDLPRTRQGRLRVGYLSADFSDHPISHLIQGLFGLHDRDQIEAYAYSFGPDDDSAYRRRIVQECEHFVDVAALSNAEIASRIHADGVHVLIDLMGYTGTHRQAALALRPAPIQASYLGMLGTTGASFLDYLIADATVTPAEAASAYREKIVRLPHSYLMCEAPPATADRRVNRAAFGLPEQGFVFCCFNSTYKLEPRMFGVWMNILRQAPGSVVWLHANCAEMKNNVRREAAARGVDADRLVFAGFSPRDQHFARHGAADLFLDTLYYNAAATASLALAAGLPVLACMGDTFASRVGASVLTAIGLEELIAPDLSAYERLAVQLAGDAGQLDDLRRKIGAHRESWPLFDTPRFVRNLERAYLGMWEVYQSGQAPRSFEVHEL